MRICIVGAGAIGGLLGVALSRSEHEISMVARGATLEAIRERGLRLRSDQEESRARPNCADDPRALGTQDVVILAVKAQQAADAAESIAPLLATETAVVTAMNGLPWWYFYKHGGEYDGQRLSSVDPGNIQWDGIGPERIIGSVVWQAAELVKPGVVEHTYGERMPLGEPDGNRSDRAVALSKVLIEAGIKSPVRPNIRNEIWVKLWGNLSFNPVSVLTHATLETLARDPGVSAVIVSMMEEAQRIGETLGVRFPMSVADRLKAAEEVGAHKTSMLQDLESGRPMEIEPLIGVVAELGRLVGVPTPTIDMVYNLVVLRAKEAGCYAG